MKTSTLIGMGLAASGTVQAGVISARQATFRFECNGQQTPKDCEAVYSMFSDGTETFNSPAGGNVLIFSAGEEKNCQVEIIWTDKSYTVTGNQVFQGINGVQTTCLIMGTGGQAVDVGNRFSIGVRNNPNYNPPDRKRSGAQLIPMGKRAPSQLDRPAKRALMSKRADGDTSFSYGVHTVNAKPGNMKHNIGNGLPGGSTWEWTSEQSVTDSVSFTSEVSAGIEGIISASVGTEISSSQTWTSGQATTITINCRDNEYGQIYFQGYAEVWQGVLLPSGQQLTVTKPTANSDGTTAGFYAYDCLPK